jgi:hypothetical protein
VILDVDAEVYRLGYGDIGALTMLEQVAADLGTMLLRQPGIRIGLVVSDADTLVFSPLPLLVEAKPSAASNQPVKPNAILLTQIATLLADELGLGEHGVTTQRIGLDNAHRSEIEEVCQDLQSNPPQKFDIARKVRVFNAAFEFVEFELLGTSIDRKTIPIPKHLSGIADKRTRDQLRTSFTLLPPEPKLSGQHLKKDKDLISKKYLRTIKDNGVVVLRTRKDEFVKDVEILRQAVSEFAKAIRDELQSAMDRNRVVLFESMLPLVERTTPKEWLRSDGTKPDAATLRQFLDEDLRRAFGSADKLIRNMEVRLVFKAVTYESLINEGFLAAAREAIPELQKIYEEFDAAKTAEPESSPKLRTS